MSTITDKQLSQKNEKPIWLIEKAPKGSGRFCAYLRPDQTPLFYYRYTDSQQKRKYLPVGSYDPKGNSGLTLKMARTKAQELASKYVSGSTDLMEVIEQEKELEQATIKRQIAEFKEKQTFAQVYQIWFDIEAAQHKDKGAEVGRQFHRDILPVLGEIDIDLVRTHDVNRVLDPILRRGASRMAKLALGRIRQIFNFAFERELVDANPTMRIKKAKLGGKDTERNRVLTDPEIALLDQQIPKANLLKTTEFAIWICLSTCCRIGELLKAEWRHIDIDNRKWIIPVENSKNGNSLQIHLSDFAVSFFKKLKTISGASRWCYPKRDNSGFVCPKTITKQLHDRQLNHYDNILSNRCKHFNTLELPNGKWTTHDLRRTGATLMIQLGVLPEVAERCLNHVEQNKIKRTYQHYSYATEMTQAWETLGHHLFELVSSRS